MERPPTEGTPIGRRHSREPWKSSRTALARGLETGAAVTNDYVRHLEVIAHFRAKWQLQGSLSVPDLQTLQEASDALAECCAREIGASWREKRQERREDER